MRVSRKRIANVIAERIKRGESLKSLSKQVASYLISVGRTNELNSIMRDVIAIRAEDGNIEAVITSAHELETKVDKEVKALVKSVKPNAKRVYLDKKLDPSLIGGFKLSVIDKSLDITARAKVNKLKQLANQGGLSG